MKSNVNGDEFEYVLLCRVGGFSCGARLTVGVFVWFSPHG